ncbi:Cornifelin like B [Dissostichus eleginoides]|uniref:Cornifelin like B n=1 Tax=Dissostichus eleginoides TaxID=100907 RepID=A0AAD9F979_DISEL|nr:Cornifelin like B [Dissostichus eleginoides]
MGAPPPEKEWSSDLFDCFEDHATCCYGFWCGPCLACTVTGRFAVLSVRVAMRNRYHIKGSLCEDMCVSCLCQSCSWCQMHRELKHRNKTPNVIIVQSQPIIQMQPAPMMMVPQAGYVTQSGVTVISN